MIRLAILTNARAADQRSMIGYGDMLLDVAQQTTHKVVELRPSSLFGSALPAGIQGWPRKVANNLDRFLVTPLKFFGSRADVVHVVDPGNAVYLPLIRHCRSIVTVHDMIPYLARAGVLTGWRPTRTGRWLLDRILTRLAKVDRIVCVSQATKSDLLSYSAVSEKRVTVIYNAVFQPLQPASSEACADLRKRLNLPPEVPLILHVGYHWYKNREMVLEVAARVRRERPDAVLLMVGALTPALDKQAEKLGLHEALHVLDCVTQEDMATLYTIASALLFPSHYEGFGLPVLEAQMCGTPVVTSDRGALPEVSSDSDTVCHHGTVEQFANEILKTMGGSRPSPSIPADFQQQTWRDAYLKLYGTETKGLGGIMTND